MKLFIAGLLLITLGFGCSTKRYTIDEIYDAAAAVKKSGYFNKEVGVVTGFISLKDKDHLRELTWTWPYGGTKPVPDELNKLYYLLLKASKDAAQEFNFE